MFQALDKDSEGIISSAQTEYNQDLPIPRPWDKIAGPPILPPHLLQVILNKDTPLSVNEQMKKKKLFSDIIKSNKYTVIFN